MKKSQLGPSVLETLEALAFGVKEAFSEKGHLIKDAIAMDPAFSINRHPESWLTRNVLQLAVEEKAKEVGVGLRFSQALDFSVFEPDANVEHAFRIKKASIVKGKHQILAPGGTESGEVPWGRKEEDSLFEVSTWVLGYIPESEQVRVFVAHALGVAQGRPANIEIDAPIFLDGKGWDPSDRVFVPADEDLPGFDVPEEFNPSLFG